MLFRSRHGQTVPPYRETQYYVSKVKGVAGKGTSAAPRTANSASGATGDTSEGTARPTHIYRVVQMVDGQEVVTYTDHDPGKAVGDWR